MLRGYITKSLQKIDYTKRRKKSTTRAPNYKVIFTEDGLHNAAEEKQVACQLCNVHSALWEATESVFQ